MDPFEKLWQALVEASIVVHPSENPEWTQWTQKRLRAEMRKQRVVVTDLDLPVAGTSSGRIALSTSQKRS